MEKLPFKKKSNPHRTNHRGNDSQYVKYNLLHGDPFICIDTMFFSPFRMHNTLSNKYCLIGHVQCVSLALYKVPLTFTVFTARSICHRHNLPQRLQKHRGSFPPNRRCGNRFDEGRRNLRSSQVYNSASVTLHLNSFLTCAVRHFREQKNCLLYLHLFKNKYIFFLKKSIPYVNFIGLAALLIGQLSKLELK